MKVNSIDKLLLTLLIIGSVLMLFPFLWMLGSSFKPISESLQIPPKLLSPNMNWHSYVQFFQKLNFGIHLKNSLILVVLSYAGLFLALMASYGFAKFQFPHKEKIFLMVLATMMIPYPITIIPNYIITTVLHLNNTYLGMVLPSLVGAYSVFLMRQFMSTIPNEMMEAARVDGLGEISIFLKIVLSMSKPIISIQAILLFISSWNNYLWPSIVATSQDKYPLSVAVLLLNSQNSVDIPLQMAAATIMVIPTVIVFLIFQKNILQFYNIEGIK